MPKRDSKGRFLKGVATEYRHPKGLRTSPDTEFKPGLIPLNARPTGVPTIQTRGEVVTCTDELVPAKTRGKTYRRRRRTSYARYIWEQTHGPIPEGHVIWCRRKGEIPTLDDLELISRAELMRRNSRK